MATSTQTFVDFALEAAWRAGQLTLAYFNTGTAAEWKADASPVTIADRSAEQLLRAAIEARFPDHAIVGEEFGQTDRDSTHRWFLDPIDGTQSFIRGVPLYGVMVGLQIAGDMVAGVVVFPALGETVSAGARLGCRWNGRPAHVSATSRLEDALVCYTDSTSLEQRRGPAWDVLKQRSKVQRGWSDCYGHALVATGRADIMLDPVMNPWDCAALLPIVREAGGTFTDWGGRVTIDGGHAISTNRLLFEQVMEAVET